MLTTAPTEVERAPREDDLSAWNDLRLAPYILAPAEERGEALAALLAEVRPVMERVVRTFRRAESLYDSNDAEDAVANATLRLIRRLAAVTQSREGAIIELDDYVATVTYNAVHDVFRRRFPERTRLQNQLRYVAKNDPRLTLTATRSGVVVGLDASTSRAPVDNLDADVPVTAVMLNRNAPGDAMEAVLRCVGAPVLLAALTSFFARQWGVADVLQDGERSADVEPMQLERLESRQFLTALWRELLDLQPQHRLAVLLNLREADGGNAVALFPLLGVATFAEIASALDMTIPELAELWGKLPLDDLTIAARMNATRQQVINLRRTARERLARRLASLLRP